MNKIEELNQAKDAFWKEISKIERYRTALEQIANTKAKSLTDQYYALARLSLIARKALEDTP